MHKLISLSQRATALQAPALTASVGPSVSNKHSFLLSHLEANKNAMIVSQNRFFFGSSKKQDAKEKEPAKDEESKEKEEAADEAEEKEKEGKKEEKAAEAEKSEKEEEQATASSEEELSSEDIKKIKALITEQDETIEAHEK